MSTLEITIGVILIVLLIIELFGYNALIKKIDIFNQAVKDFDTRATKYESSFNDIAENVILLTGNVTGLHERQSDMNQHLMEIETLVSIHSEALNTKQLNDLITSRLPNLTTEIPK